MSPELPTVPRGGQYCTFLIDGLLFGVEASRVQEVLKPQELTPVPRAPRAVSGLLNLRGEIVTALDVRTRLGLPQREGGRPSMNVVLRDEGGAVSLLVDEIGEVLDADEASFEPPPQTLRGPFRDLLSGTYKLDGKLLLVLDVDLAISPQHL